MSLLMDALKRAEKARQAQAEKQSDEKGESTSKLTLDPLESEQPPAGDSRPSPDPPVPPADPATTHFSLSDDDDPTAEQPPAPKPPAAPDDDKLGPFSLVRDDELSMEDTGEMTEVVKEAEKSLNDYFDDGASEPTQRMPRDEKTWDDASTHFGLDDTDADGNTAAAAGSRAGSDAGSEGASKLVASRVFEAKAPKAARQRRDRRILIAVPLILLGIVGLGAAFLWDELMRTFVGGPPILPKGPPPAASAPPVEPKVSPAPESRQLAAAAEAATPAGNAAPEPAQAAAASQPAAAAKTNPVPVAATVAPADAGGVRQTQASTGAERPTRPRSAPESPEGARPAERAALTRQALSATGAFPGGSFGGIRISKKSRPDQVHAQINEAYAAFERGNNATARALYARVLNQHPSNRNALLGLAALAVRDGDMTSAMGLYARMLSIDPRDPIARAALIDINRSVSAGEGEAHVKFLLAEYPEQAFLYFTLGNVYARQARWPEAQQAYFDAYSRNSANADYAFNLAVSLDHMGQGAAALSYYRRAVELALEGPYGFDVRAAQMRVDRLGSETAG